MIAVKKKMIAVNHMAVLKILNRYIYVRVFTLDVYTKSIHVSVFHLICYLPTYVTYVCILMTRRVWDPFFYFSFYRFCKIDGRGEAFERVWDLFFGLRFDYVVYIYIYITAHMLVTESSKSIAKRVKFCRVWKVKYFMSSS